MKRALDSEYSSGTGQRLAHWPVRPLAIRSGIVPNMVMRPHLPDYYAQTWFAPANPSQLQHVQPGFAVAVQTTVPMLVPGIELRPSPNSAFKTIAGATNSSNDSAPALNPESAPAPGLMNTATSQAGSQTVKPAGTRKTASDLEYMMEWKAVADLEDRVAAWAAPKDIKLTGKTHSTALTDALPQDLLNRICCLLEVRDMQAYALTCKPLYKHCNEHFPLRLQTLIKLLLPVGSKSPPSKIMVQRLLTLIQKENGMDQLLFTPMGERLRAAMTLALVACMRSERIYGTTELAARAPAIDAIQRLGEGALFAFSDLLEEFVRQSDTASTSGFKFTDSERRAETPYQLLPILIPVLKEASPALGRQVLISLARFLIRLSSMYYRDEVEQTLSDLYQSHPQFFSPEIRMLLTLSTGMRADWLADDLKKADVKIEIARICLAEYARIARSIKVKLREIEEKPRAKNGGLATPVKNCILNQSDRLLAVQRLFALLKLSSEDERDLAPMQLRLLEVEVENLDRLNRVIPPLKREQRYWHLKKWLEDEALPRGDEQYAGSIALRIARLTKLAIESRQTQPAWIDQLASIVRLWPKSAGGADLLKWFTQKTSNQPT